MTHQLRFHVLLLPFLLSGCGGKYDLRPVEGTVTLTDGTPLTRLRLTFECQDPVLSARATTDEKGKYQLSTLTDGDGAPIGSYRVAIGDLPGDDPDDFRPSRIHSKYQSFDTSGLTFEVGDGDNVFDIQLDPPERR